jgi:outer membrane protein TolC
MIKKFKIAFIIFLALSKLVYAQKTWSLDECIAYALEHNLQLNDFKYTNESSKETYRQSFRDLLPSVRAVSDYNIRYGRSVNPNDNSFINTEFFSNSYSLEASIDLFKGFQKINSIKASQFINSATQEETKQQKYLLAFRVMQAFYDIQFFEGALEIAQEQVGISKVNYNLVNKQIELGLKAGADLYEAESLWLTDKLSVKQAYNQLIAAKLILIQEMNLEGYTDISLVNKLVGNIEISELSEAITDTIYRKAQDFIPIIKAGKFRVEASKRQVSIERGKLYPSLTLFGGYGTGYYETITDNSNNIVPFKKQFKDNTFRIVGISLNIPISNGWSGWSKVKQQKIESLRAENDLKAQEQELYNTVQTLVQERKALKIEYEQSNKNVESQRLAFVVAQKRYENGLINAIELYTVKNLFASAQNKNLQVRLQSEINSSTLDFYRGLPVFNIND